MLCLCEVHGNLPAITKPGAPSVHSPEVQKMTHETETTGITIRRLGDADEPAVLRLAELDSSVRPAGPLLGAEIEGRLLVAVSIETGTTIADPFARTAELRGLVEMRSAQLRGHPGRRGAGLRARGASRSRPAVASSPARTGGELLTLPTRLS
jgi:hypothetical protein